MFGIDFMFGIASRYAEFILFENGNGAVKDATPNKESGERERRSEGRYAKQCWQNNVDMTLKYLADLTLL